MRFGVVPVREALGGVVAHAVRQGDLVLRKGAIVTQDDVARLLAAGVADITVALLDSDDMGEDEAAAVLAASCAGGGVRVEPPATGRSNLFALADGVLRIDRAMVDAANRIDEAITLATLPHLRRVRAGEMVATVKIIPFAAPGGLVRAAVSATPGAVAVAPFVPRRVALISTVLPGLKPSVIDKTRAVLAERLERLAGSAVISEQRCARSGTPISSSSSARRRSRTGAT
jgi:molybdenum cofactor cytidylyltransferase